MHYERSIALQRVLQYSSLLPNARFLAQWTLKLGPGADAGRSHWRLVIVGLSTGDRHSLALTTLALTKKIVESFLVFLNFDTAKSRGKYLRLWFTPSNVYYRHGPATDICALAAVISSPLEALRHWLFFSLFADNPRFTLDLTEIGSTDQFLLSRRLSIQLT